MFTDGPQNAARGRIVATLGFAEVLAAPEAGTIAMWFGDVEMPRELVNAQEAGQLVIFVGAGASIGHPSDLPSFGRLTEIIRDESELNDVIDDALFWVGMRAGVVGLVAVAFSNEVGTITTLSKCSSKLAMLTGNGQRTLAVR